MLATWLAIPPAAGYAALAHFDGEGKRSAFDEAREVLSSLAARLPERSANA